MGDAGIVDEDVEAVAEALFGCLEQVPHAIGQADIGGAGRGLSAGRADLLCCGLRAVAVDIGEQHVRALGGEAAADLAADAAPAAGDDGRLALRASFRLTLSVLRPGVSAWRGAESTLAGPGPPGYPAAAMRAGRDT